MRKRRSPGGPGRRGSSTSRTYSHWFLLPAGILFAVFFVVPAVMSFYFSLTRWTLFEAEFIGFDNFVTFFTERTLVDSLGHTLIYVVITSSLKVVLGIVFAVVLSSSIIGTGLLRSVVFFPVLVSVIGVAFTFVALMRPEGGAINTVLSFVGIQGPAWLTDPSIALISVSLVDVWKGVGLATIIFLAGLASIPSEYLEAAEMDGAGSFRKFWNITLPLLRPATVTVVLLTLIAGMKHFEFVWAMTEGGPGFSTDVLASVVYKQYQSGFYGLSTAGNVVLFAIVLAVVLPLSIFLNRKEARDAS